MSLHQAQTRKTISFIYTVKSQIFIRYLFSYFRTFEKVLNFILYEYFFCFEAIELQCDFIMKLSKVGKLVRTNQFQVKSTKMGTRRKFVTLQYAGDRSGKLNIVKRPRSYFENQGISHENYHTVLYMPVSLVGTLFSFFFFFFFSRYSAGFVFVDFQGGLVARALLAQPEFPVSIVNAIVTLATPHQSAGRCACFGKLNVS